MRTSLARRLLPLLLIAALVGCAGTQQQARPPVDSTALVAALDSVSKAFVAAVAARDTDAVVSFYAPDAMILPAGMVRVDGQDAIRTMWVEFLKTPGLELSFSGSTPVITEAGDMIIDVGRYAMKMNDAKGRPVEDIGKYVTVFKKVDGSWKIAIDTFNSDKAPPA